MNIYLIRHGRQNSSLCNVNVPLSEEGIKQAYLLADRLSTYSIDAIYSSDLYRAIETADIIKEKLGLNNQIVEEFKEISFGDLEGLRDDVIKVRFKDFLQRRGDMEEDIPYPNGENGKDVYNRVYPILRQIIKKDYKNVVIVTHGGVIRSLLAGILGDDFSKKLVFSKDLENTSITQLFYSENNDKFYIERVNDYAHLESDKTLLRKYFKKGF